MGYEMQTMACKRWVVVLIWTSTDGGCRKIDAFCLWRRGAQSCESSQAATVACEGAVVELATGCKSL